MPDLIASRAFTYSSRRLVAGDAFRASNQDARVLVALGKARHAPAAEPDQLPVPTGQAAEQQAPQAAGTEPAGAVAVEHAAAETVEPAPEAVKTEPAAPARGQRRGGKVNG